jgi:hypothetical protein
MYIEEQGNGKEKSQIVFDLESSSSLPSIIAVSANREKRRRRRRKKLNLNDQVIIIVVLIKEKEASKQLTLHHVYTANDCFGRRPSVRSSLFFSRASPLLLLHKKHRGCNSTHID